MILCNACNVTPCEAFSLFKERLIKTDSNPYQFINQFIPFYFLETIKINVYKPRDSQDQNFREYYVIENNPNLLQK